MVHVLLSLPLTIDLIGRKDRVVLYNIIMLTEVGQLSTINMIWIEKTNQNYFKVAKGEKVKKNRQMEERPITFIRSIDRNFSRI